MQIQGTRKITAAGVMGRCADMQAVHVGYCAADVARFGVWSGSVFSVHSGKDLAGPKQVRKVTKRFDVCKDRVKIWHLQNLETPQVWYL